MAKHEFGIMEQEPLSNERFETYEPETFNCIAVDDEFIEPIIEDLQVIDCYWHTLKIAGKGLAYCGISLIPPQSLEAFIRILSAQNNPEYTSLIELAVQAKEKGKFMIHFGI